MINKSANARDYRENLHKEIKDIRKQSVISEELKDFLVPDELDLIQEARAQKAKQESREKLDSVKDTDEYKEAKEIKKQSQELVKKIMELTGKSKEEAEETVYGKSEKSETKEAKEKLPETAQSKNRDSMLSYAQKNDTEYAERIEGRLGIINELRAKGIISDLSEGVNVKGLGKFASTKTHNKVLEENFGNKVNEPFDWDNHAGNNSKLNTVRKDDLDKKMKKGLVGNYKLGSKKFIENTIFPWIEQKFEGVKNQDDKLYILQLINPDLFTRLWLDSVDSTGHFRQLVKLERSVDGSYFGESNDGSNRGGLFLVGNA